MNPGETRECPNRYEYKGAATAEDLGVSADRELEGRILQRLRVGFRTVVLLNWLSMLVFWFLNGITKDVRTGAFTVFRVTAVCATLWLYRAHSA